MFKKLILLLLVGMVCSTGCVQRRLVVKSQPEGALVTVDNQVVGQTPLSVPFVYYGTRQIRLEREGYQTVNVKERFRPKWYDTFPFSFLSNNFAMREIRDTRVLDFQLEPKANVEENQLLNRANELRTNSQRGTLAPKF
jgi:hypothetical protein